MKMKKCFAIVLALILALIPSFAHALGTIVQNGDFTQGMAAWEKRTWITANSEFFIENGALHISSSDVNDARLAQKIIVTPKTNYKVSCKIKVDNIFMEANVGAWIGFDYTYAQCLAKNELSDWQDIEFYCTTNDMQNELTLNVALGGYSALASGDAWFNSISVEQVDSIPDGATFLNCASYDNDVQAVEGEDNNGFLPIEYNSSLIRMLIFAVFGALIIGGLFLWSRNSGWNVSEKTSKRLILFVLIFAFLIRVVLTLMNKGYPTDTSTFAYWTQRIASVGPGEFYAPDIFCDYPPGMIYLLSIGGLLSKALNIVVLQSGKGLLLMMLPILLCDVALCYVIYRYAKRTLSAVQALGLSAVYAIMPAGLMDSALWHQVDPVLVLALVVTFILIEDKKMLWAAFAYGIAILLKPQALIVGPVFAIMYIIPLMKDSDGKWISDKPLVEILKIPAALIISLATIFIFSMPFRGNQDQLWLIDKYFATVTSYPYATINAYNFFGLLGFNWGDESMLLGPMSLRNWGYFGIIATVLTSILLAISFSRKNSRDKRPPIFLLGAFIVAGVFCLAPRMHERYGIPVLALLLLAYAQQKDRGIMNAFFAFEAVTYANIAIALFTLNEQYVVDRTILSQVIKIVSFFNVVTFIYLTIVCFDICFSNRSVAYSLYDDSVRKPALQRFLDWEPQKLLLNWNRKDIILCGVLTIVYAVLAFYNLGTTKVPQTYWRGSPQEVVEVDFGHDVSISQIWSYGGISDANLGIVDASGNQFATIPVNYDQMYRWTVTKASTVTSHVSLVPDKSIWLNELIFIDDKGNVIKSVPSESEAVPLQEDSDSSFQHIFDESDVKPERPDVTNGMYFDELYHGRTAYEHLKGLTPYENTHPPLGKILIMLGIKLFGMTPFGWRCVGTLFGVLMVPLMFALSKRLFKSTKLAFFASFLFTFDFMHYVQTRISTIDVYGVFFILCMYYFMLVYTQLNFYVDGLKKTLIPLGLCGLFFGIGAASKWICIYAGFGLAILFFAALFKRYNEYQLIKDAAEKGDEDAKIKLESTESFTHNALATLSFCIIMFIVIPAAIYIASYTPYLLCKDQKYNFESIIDLNKSMFRYHSELTARHAFESKWWAWMIDLRPMWYYMGQELPDGQVASIAAMGNPAVWWSGLIALFATIGYGIKRKFNDPRAVFIVVGFASQFVPWMMISRATFIYHYFASVPFIIFALTFIFAKWQEHIPSQESLEISKMSFAKYKELLAPNDDKKSSVFSNIPALEKFNAARWSVAISNKKAINSTLIALMAITLILFIVFFPLLNGLPISTQYAQLLLWFPSWTYYYGVSPIDFFKK